MSLRYPRTVPPIRKPTTPRGKRRAKTSAPSLALLMSPFFVFSAAVLLGAVHRWLGEPLGARFAGEVWDLSRNLGIMLVTAGPFAVYVQRANANAIAASKTPAALSLSGETADRDEEENDDHDHDARRDIRRVR